MNATTSADAQTFHVHGHDNCTCGSDDHTHDGGCPEAFAADADECTCSTPRYMTTDEYLLHEATCPEHQPGHCHPAYCEGCCGCSPTCTVRPCTVVDADTAGIQALSNAGSFCGNCGFEPGERGCPDCRSHWAHCIEKLRAAGWAPRTEVLREAAPELDAHCEKYGVLGVGDRLRRMADAAE